MSTTILASSALVKRERASARVRARTACDSRIAMEAR